MQTLGLKIQDNKIYTHTRPSSSLNLKSVELKNFDYYKVRQSKSATLLMASSPHRG